ncbi:hypothetical protein Pmar_PMAR028563 [Perkinsus marinus ATCC 50983]|uniref:Uncharacterized protein n=1 Tax=Perkinsus marinus (strain ATCC 50983 / TXsc) TaxID=423536 RepID=C5K5G8_PERM5|nr:hypothetical protein Pmar_PMAR028563 [Perkinsus marinus ATCC 50983]EER20284.1 hypothetical protein Pmar_PMAR028563 [Perkinsus marinus ATCC 50983]|eukprot:XP_002788488.1 hypothetical protein Pmar_PMAR028563 [Perkinsus marinus ATCC 50983]
MSLDFFQQRKSVAKGPQFINTPGWIPGHVQREDVRLRQANVKRPTVVGGAPLVNRVSYGNLQEAAIAPRAGSRRTVGKGSKKDKARDLGERLAHHATKGETACHKMKKSREHRRLLYRGDEFLKKTLKNTTIVEPNYGHNEPIRLLHWALIPRKCVREHL